jgi:hypothetical protein
MSAASGDAEQLQKYLDADDFDSIVENGLVPELAERLRSAEAFRTSILARLNEALDLDHDAMVKLMLHTVPCNEALQAKGVSIDVGTPEVSLLGILMHGGGGYAPTFAAAIDAPSTAPREEWIPTTGEFVLLNEKEIV